jgi:hypothetical protein
VSKSHVPKPNAEKAMMRGLEFVFWTAVRTEASNNTVSAIVKLINSTFSKIGVGLMAAPIVEEWTILELTAQIYLFLRGIFLANGKKSSYPAIFPTISAQTPS